MRSRPPLRPNFFLIGAPKCGTTSLSEYLRAHPQICFSEPKEPHFFAVDRPQLRQFLTEKEYLKRAFGHCHGRHVAIGEGSTHYLLSEVAIQKILSFQPTAKLIALVRNPIQLVQSLHHEYLFDFVEDEPDFEEAWRLQSLRSAGQRIPRRCPDPRLLQYREVGMLGSHIARVLSMLNSDQLLVLVFDDLAQNPGAVYRAALTFLGVEDDGRTEFPVANVRRIQSAAFRRAVGAVPSGFWNAVVRFRRVFGLKEFGIRRWLGEVTAERVYPEPLRDDFRAELSQVFRDDVERLSDLLNRDLSHWLEPESGRQLASERRQP